MAIALFGVFMNLIGVFTIHLPGPITPDARTGYYVVILIKIAKKLFSDHLPSNTCPFFTDCWLEEAGAIFLFALPVLSGQFL